MALFKIHFQKYGTVCGDIEVTNHFVTTEDPEQITRLKKHKLFGSGIELLSADEEAKGSHEPHITYKEAVKTRQTGSPQISPFEELFTPHELEQIRSLDSQAKETIIKNVRAILNDRFTKSGDNANNSDELNAGSLDEGESLNDITPPGSEVIPATEKEMDKHIEQVSLKKEVLQAPFDQGKEGTVTQPETKIEEPQPSEVDKDTLESKKDFELKLILEGLEDENHKPVIVPEGATRETMIELIRKYENLRENEIINK